MLFLVHSFQVVSAQNVVWKERKLKRNKLHQDPCNLKQFEVLSVHDTSKKRLEQMEKNSPFFPKPTMNQTLIFAVNIRHIVGDTFFVFHPWHIPKNMVNSVPSSWRMGKQDA